MKTRRARATEIERAWHLIDVQGKPLGRVATQVARILMGKHKPLYEPFLDVGDFVVVINAQRIYVQDRKLRQKMYYRYSGYPGGMKQRSLAEMLANKPEQVFRLAVKGMLPKNRLGRQMIRKLKVYGGDSHPHDAQRPQPFVV